MSIVISSILFVLFVAVVVVYFVRRWRGMARHGRLALPCDEVVELPAGEVVAYFEEARRLRVSERPGPPLNFSLLITEERSGRRVQTREPSDPTGFKAGRRSRAPYAALRLPRPGRYRVVASAGGDTVEPHITFG